MRRRAACWNAVAWRRLFHRASFELRLYPRRKSQLPVFFIPLVDDMPRRLGAWASPPRLPARNNRKSCVVCDSAIDRIGFPVSSRRGRWRATPPPPHACILASAAGVMWSDVEGGRPRLSVFHQRTDSVTKFATCRPPLLRLTWSTCGVRGNHRVVFGGAKVAHLVRPRFRPFQSSPSPPCLISSLSVCLFVLSVCLSPVLLVRGVAWPCRAHRRHPGGASFPALEKSLSDPLSCSYPPFPPPSPPPALHARRRLPTRR